MSLSILLALGMAVGTANPAPVVSAPATRSTTADRQLSKAIVAKLTSLKKAGKLTNFDLSIDVESGTVWLKGSVSSSTQRSLIRRSVKGVRNVRTVIDDVTIQANTSTKRKRVSRQRPNTSTKRERVSPLRPNTSTKRERVSPLRNSRKAIPAKAANSRVPAQLVKARPTLRNAARRRVSELVAPPQPTPAKPKAKHDHGHEGHEHVEHVEGEIAYADNWSPDGCACANGKLPCPFHSTCDMPQHQQYSAQPAFYYYFRPYQWTHVSLQQQEAAKYGLSPSNPYDNRFFEAIYKQVDDKIGMQREPSKHVQLRPRQRHYRSPLPAPIFSVRPVSKLVYPKVREKKPALKPLDLGKIDDEPIYRKKAKVNARKVNYLSPKKVTLKKK